MGLADERFLVEAGDDDGQERARAVSVAGGTHCHWFTFTAEPLAKYRY